MNLEDQVERALEHLRINYHKMRTENEKLRQEMELVRQAEQTWRSRCEQGELSHTAIRSSLSLLQENVREQCDFEEKFRSLQIAKAEDEDDLKRSHANELAQLKSAHEAVLEEKMALIQEMQRTYEQKISALELDLVDAVENGERLARESQSLADMRNLQEEMLKMQAMYKELENKVQASPVHNRTGAQDPYYLESGHPALQPVQIPTKTTLSRPSTKKKRVTFDVGTPAPSTKMAKTTSAARKANLPPTISDPSHPTAVIVPKTKSLSDLFAFNPTEVSSTVKRSGSTGQKRKLYSPVVTSNSLLQ